MVFNLINDKWIPVRRSDGTQEIIAPWQVIDNIDSNPIVSLDANRPDFNGALIQFLIGLVQTTMAPKREINWENKFDKPPEADELKTAFANVSHAFNLDGDSPRFMQDFDLDNETEWRIDTLLADMPSSEEDNQSHFVKYGTVGKICLPCSAMALFTLQTNAPSGGRGYMTSLRGGGPLTTIVMGDTLWQTIWLNVLNEPAFLGNYENSSTDDGAIFPWMRPTRTSEKKQKTTPGDVHPAQMFWGMPRRIVMNFEADDACICDLCGSNIHEYVKSYNPKNYGVKYDGGWRHTLTPYRTNAKKERNAKHGESGGITFRHWIGLVQNDSEKMNETAMVVHTFRGRQKEFENKKSFKLWAFGYDFVPGQMKVRCWYEGKMPLINVDDSLRENYESVIEQIIKASVLALKNTIISIKNALFNKDKTKKIKDELSFIDMRFWNCAEADFYVTLDKLHEALTNGSDTNYIKIQWLKVLFRIGEQLFDDYSQSNQIGEANPRRIARAHKNLIHFNSEYNEEFRNILYLPIM